MSRDRFSNEPEMNDREERIPFRERGDSTEGARDVRSDSPPVASRDADRRPEIDGPARAYYLRDRTYLLRESEFTTLVEIGRFRVIDTKDLAEFGYAGDAKRMNREIRHLTQQGLVAMKSSKSAGRGTAGLLVLTKKAKRLIQQSGRLPKARRSITGL